MKFLPYLLAGSAALAASTAIAATPPEAATSMPTGATQPPVTTEDTTQVDVEPNPTLATSEDTADPTAAETAAPNAAPSAFTDVQIESFAAAAIKIQALDADPAATPEQKLAIVSQSGIDAGTYNAIATAMAQDKAVADRVQIAAAAMKDKTDG